MDEFKLVEKLHNGHILDRAEWTALIRGYTPELAERVFELAREWQHRYYGNRIFVRGLIEMTNYCRNDCYYCGIRRSNRNAERYRLTWEEIRECADLGAAIGYRTIVLQGGEDPFYSDEEIAEIVREIKADHPDCAVTLSLGEREHETYRKWYDAGAYRYLLRHETADPDHYRMLHPAELSGEHRKNCLRDLKAIGYQTGAGMMIGAPGQTPELLAEDMLFLQELQPEMVGIGPFIPHHDTPFANEPQGSVEQTIYLLGLIRLTLPRVLLPATTALGTADPFGREKGVQAGANVIMPNLSPADVRKKYELYDNKICTDSEAAENLRELQDRMKAVGYEIVTDRGDYKWA